MTDAPQIVLKPQEGPQEAFISCNAEIVIYGGAAFGGKTFGLLLDPTRYIHVPQFRAVVFRRTKEQVRNPGGLWDESQEIYPSIGGAGHSSALVWKFPSGAEIKFAHLEHEKNIYDWLGAQIPYIAFDQLEGFTEKMFWYLFGRCRSVANVPKFIRATCNPKPDSWLAKMIQWWWDEKTGFAHPERSGVVRYFIRLGNKLTWGDSWAELHEKYPLDVTPPGVYPDGKHERRTNPTSFTFIKGSIQDNQIGMIKDPGYLGKLKAMPLVERMQLLEGNWKVRATAGMMFKRAWYKVVETVPWECSRNRLRYWDRAATPKTETNDPAWTVGTLMSRDDNGRTYVEDVVRFRGTPAEVERTIVNTASRDGFEVAQWLEEDVGQAGKADVANLTRSLAGYNVKSITALRATQKARLANESETNAKVIRARGFSSASEQGNVFIVKGEWNEEWFDEFEAFPEGAYLDQVDSGGGGYNALSENTGGGFVLVDDGRRAGKVASISHERNEETDEESGVGRGRILI